jgi:hypothetical protein
MTYVRPPIACECCLICGRLVVCAACKHEQAKSAAWACAPCDYEGNERCVAVCEGGCLCRHNGTVGGPQEASNR